MPRPGRMTTERAKDFKGTLLQLVRNLGRYRLSLVTAIVFAILSTIFNIAGPKVLAKATTALATGWIAKLRGTGSIDFVYIGRILLFLLGMYLLSSAFSFIQGWLMTGLSQKVCYDFRKQISEKINRLPLAYFEKRTVGEVLSRITNDVDTLGQSLNQSITQLITSVTTMIGVLIMMLSISPRMTLIALLILPVSLALVLLVVRFSQKYFKAQQATLGVVNGQVEEIYSGHNVVKAFNREAVVLNDFNAANDKLYESAWKSQFLSGLMMPIMNFVGNLGYVAVAIVGSIFAANGKLVFDVKGIKAKSDTIIAGKDNVKVYALRERNGMIKLYIDGKLDCSGYDVRNAGADIAAGEIKCGASVKSIEIFNRAFSFDEVKD